MKGYEIFIRKFVPPVVYKKALDGAFGDWYDWEPETVLQEIRRVWGVDPIEEVGEKIFALQTFGSTDLFWDDPVVFENIVLAFNDRLVDPDLWQACNPDEIAYGVTVANQIKQQDRKFSRDVIEYIRACHRHYGQIVYHPVLDFAQPDYEDPFRRELAVAVIRATRKGRLANVNDENAVEVQQAKLLDCDAYVQERMAKGAEIARV